MSAIAENKRSNKRAKKKRAARTAKDEESQYEISSTVKKMTLTSKTDFNTSIPLSEVVKKSSFTPFLDGERCILCQEKRPAPRSSDKCVEAREALFGTQNLVEKLPLWVCPDCRKKVEEDEEKGGFESNVHSVDNDGRVQSWESNTNSYASEESKKDLCSCNVCAGKRHLVPAKTKEIEELQFSWWEVKHFVRCVYRKAGTTLADDDTLSKTSHDIDRMKRHTEKLTKKDAYQLYQRLEVQAREYLNEVRVSLVKFYSSTSSNSLQHAKDCVMTLLDEYKSLCVATDILKPFFQKLEDDLLVKWKWSWELMNKEVFKEEIFHDSIIGLNFPLLFQQLVRSETSASGNDENHKSEIMKRFEAFTWEVTDVDDRWLATKPLLEIYERENGSGKRGEHENWDEPLKNTKRENRCTCGHCDFLTSESTTVSIKRPLPSSHIANPYCSWHTQIGCKNGTELTSTSPTGMFLDHLSTSKCASCMREALHSFCFDQNTFPNTCQYHTDHDPPKPPSHPKSSQCLYQSSYDPFWYNNDPLSPETASSIQNLLVNGTSGNRCQNNPCCTQHYGQCDDKRYKEQKGHCIPPSITIPGNDSNVEAPPSSPSSDRSVGDGSSCDSPPSPCSLSDESKSNNGKYCDCCYCEFFGQGNPPVAQTSHNFVEMREKLRSRLKERKAIDFSDNPKALRCITDTRSVDELLTFINGDEERNVSNKTATKAAKRQRKKQKKAVEKGDISCQESGLSEPKGKQEGRPLICKIESGKASQQESDKRKSQKSLTEKKNAENYLKSLNNLTKQEETTAKHGQGVGVKLKTVNHANVQKKNKAEKEVVTKDGEHKKTRMANGYSSKCANFVEESHEQRFSAGKEDESKCCDKEEVPSQETDYQKRKTKNRKKKKAQCLGELFASLYVKIEPANI